MSSFKKKKQFLARWKWYQWLKTLVSKDKANFTDITVKGLDKLTTEEQAKALADSFSSISQEYKLLEESDIKIPHSNPQDVQSIGVQTVKKKIKT